LKKIIYLVIVSSFLLIGCSSKQESVSKKYDIVKIVPYGFKEACRNCNPGYTTKEVCGKYFNASCERKVKSVSIKEQVKATKPLKKKLDVLNLKPGQSLKIFVPSGRIVIKAEDIEKSKK